MNLHRSIIVASITVLFAAAGCGDNDLRKKGSTDSPSNNQTGQNSMDSNNENSGSGVNNVNGDSGTNSGVATNKANSTGGPNNTNDTGGLNNEGLNNRQANNETNESNENNTNGSNNETNNDGPTNHDNNTSADEFRSIHVQLTWNTDQTDLDVHLAHPLAAEDTNQPDLDGDGSPDPWLHGTYDCSWRNRNPEWGSAGTHNPIQDFDDVDGFGPENINLDEPEGVDYRIGVRYYSGMAAGDPPPQTVATVKVYVDGNLEYEASRTLSVHDMWEVGSVDGRSGTVTPATANGGPKVTPGYNPDIEF